MTQPVSRKNILRSNAQEFDGNPLAIDACKPGVIPTQMHTCDKEEIIRNNQLDAHQTGIVIFFAADFRPLECGLCGLCGSLSIHPWEISLSGSSTVGCIRTCVIH